MAIVTLSASAQTDPIKLKFQRQTRQEAISEIQSQTRYNVLSDSYAFDKSTQVNFGKTELPLNTLLGKLLEGTNLTYAVDGKYIIIHSRNDKKQTTSVVTVVTTRNITGTVNDSDGNPIEGATVAVIEMDKTGQTATTFANGRFKIEGVQAGNHVIKLTSADGETVRYREVNVQTGRDAEVTLNLGGTTLASAPAAEDKSAAQPQLNKTTAYFVPSTPIDPTIQAFSGETKSTYSFIPTSEVDKQYLPKVGVKTNLLYLATTSPNLAVEFGLAPKWTLDASAVFNPFQLQKGGINLFWFVQPEFRYWFCQRFERHFIGLHGIYGRFNIGEVGFLTRTFEDHRYKGWGAGGGISYGYHLPMNKRWAWEFTVGAGVVYYEYDKFRCYGCDDYQGHNTGIYFGPTKAGISLIYMIK